MPLINKMFYWSPTGDNIEEWQPTGGWNSVFSEQDKIQCTNLFFFFKNKKGFKENIATMMAQMVLFKQKYSGMSYSDEQEAQLREALKPVFNS
jgi:predicted adenine nucleotide alpha hydrolase (AANH) superfamily ATPase